MAMLKNPRHEAFAQALSRGFSANKAYEHVGYTGGQSAASRLSHRVEITARVEELKQRTLGGLTVTKAWVIEQLVENVDVAMQRKPIAVEGKYITGPYNGAIATRALELIGKELGMFIDRTEIGRAGDFDALNDRELGTLLVAELAGRREPESAHARLGAQAEAGEGVAH